MARPLRDLVQPAPPQTPADRLRAAIELHQVGLDLMRARLRREHPDASSAEVERRLGAWLRDVPPLTAPGFSTRQSE